RAVPRRAAHRIGRRGAPRRPAGHHRQMGGHAPAEVRREQVVLQDEVAGGTPGGGEFGRRGGPPTPRAAPIEPASGGGGGGGGGLLGSVVQAPCRAFRSCSTKPFIWPPLISARALSAVCGPPTST